VLLPHDYLSSVHRIDAEYLRARGIEGLLLDIDGTLKDFAARSLPPAIVDWLQRLGDAGVRLCLLSNGRQERIGVLAAELGLPFVAEALKPMPTGCRRGIDILGLPATRVAVVGDQIYADIMAGRLAGLHTILVCPTSRVEPWFTRLKRPFEAPIRLWLRRRLDAPALVHAPDSI
jgi:HAD superfamily phosphatase (TIGR01668 family)